METADWGRDGELGTCLGCGARRLIHRWAHGYHPAEMGSTPGPRGAPSWPLSCENPPKLDENGTVRDHSRRNHHGRLRWRRRAAGAPTRLSYPQQGWGGRMPLLQPQIRAERGRQGCGPLILTGKAAKSPNLAGI